MITVTLFLQHQLSICESRLRLVSGQARQASTMQDLVQAAMGVASASPGHLKALVRARPQYRQTNFLLRERGEKIIKDALIKLSDHKSETDSEFKAWQGRFIVAFREPCRGHFPELYQLAEKGLRELNTWRHQNLVAENSTSVPAAPRP